MGVLIGVDIGQKHDPTAIVVVEEETRGSEDDEYHYLVRHLERMPLGTPYPEVAQRIASMAKDVKLKVGDRSSVFLDATGVGQPVVDLLRQEEFDAVITPVYFTFGDRRSREKGRVMLGKAFLVSRLQILLQSGRLHLPRTSEAEVLAQELLDYEIRVNDRANDIYGSFKVGSHDDLVTALGLAVHEEPARWRLL